MRFETVRVGVRRCAEDFEVYEFERLQVGSDPRVKKNGKCLLPRAFVTMNLVTLVTHFKATRTYPYSVKLVDVGLERFFLDVTHGVCIKVGPP
jgi:hypothetical protein